MARITVAYMRDLERQVSREEITFSRMVELLNERANENTPEQLLPLIEKVFGPGAAKGCAERLRQIEVEGWTPEHDDQYDGDELAKASSSYILPEEWRQMIKCTWRKVVPCFFPRWDIDWWKPTPHNRIRELEKGISLGWLKLTGWKERRNKK